MATPDRLSFGTSAGKPFSQGFLADEELRPQLEARVTVVFDGQTIWWHEIERQVERLGFGDLYVVSATQGPFGDSSQISLKPEQ